MHVIAQIEVKSDPPTLRDFHEVEDCEVTEVMPMPRGYADNFEVVHGGEWCLRERVERPTTPLPHHGLPLAKLEELIAKRNR